MTYHIQHYQLLWSTQDYGIDFNDHNHPIKAFQCCCGSAFCQYTRGKGTKSSALRKPTTSGYS